MRRPTRRAMERARKRYNKLRRARKVTCKYRWDVELRCHGRNPNNLIFGLATRGGWEDCPGWRMWARTC